LGGDADEETSPPLQKEELLSPVTGTGFLHNENRDIHGATNIRILGVSLVNPPLYRFLSVFL